MNWPQENSTLFAQYEVLPMNAHLRHALHNCDWGSLFLDAARAIDKSMDSQAAQRDYLAVPAMFLCRHAVETALKDLLGYALSYHGKARDIPRIHNLEVLWNATKPLLECLKPSPEDRTIDHVESLLLQLHQVDPSSTGLRYQDSGKDNLPTEPFALDHFIDQVDALLAFFGGCTACFEQGMSYH